jgi:hypothetical protein
MSDTSAAALEFLKRDLAAAAGYGADQIAYVSSSFFSEFYRNALSAVVTAAMPAITSHHDRRLSDGPSREGEAVFTAYNNEDGGSLKIMFDNGEGAVIRWKEATKDDMRITDIEIEPVHGRLDPAILEKRDAMLRSGATLREMLPLAAEFARSGHPYAGADDQNGGIVGRVKLIAFLGRDEGYGTGKGYAAPSCQRIDLLERLAATLDISFAGRIDFDAREHLHLAREGQLLPMFASAAALAFETDIVAQLPEIGEIVSLSTDLRLGNGTVFAYGDTDRHVYAVSAEDKDVIVHDNIDLNEQNAFVLVLNRGADGYASIDAYVAQSWYHDFEEWAEVELDDPADGHAFQMLVEYTSEQQKRPNEDELVAAIMQGRPEQGLAYSYDLATGTLELGEAALRTGFLPYARLMIEGDLEALRTLRSGDLADAWGMSVQRHEIGSRSLHDEESIDPQEYVAALSLSHTADHLSRTGD